MTNKGRLPTSYLDDGRPLAFTTKQLDDGCNQPENVEKRQFCFKSGKNPDSHVKIMKKSSTKSLIISNLR